MSCVKLSTRAKIELITVACMSIIIAWLALVIAATLETCDAARFKWNIVEFFISKLPVVQSS